MSKKKPCKNAGPFVCSKSAFSGLEASVAVNRTVFLRLERNLSVSTALSADGVKHLAGSALSVLLGLTALAAAAGLVLKALFGIEFLLTGGEHELGAAIFAN